MVMMLMVVELRLEQGLHVPVPQAQLDRREIKVLLDQEVTMVLKVQQEHQAMDQLEHQDRRASKEHQELQDKMETQEQLGQQERQDIEGSQDMWAPQEQSVYQDI